MAHRATALALTAAMVAALSAPAFAGTYYIGDGDITVTKTDNGTYVKQSGKSYSDDTLGDKDDGEITIKGGSSNGNTGSQSAPADNNAATLEADETPAPVVTDEDTTDDDTTYTEPTPVVTWPDEDTDETPDPEQPEGERKADPGEQPEGTDSETGEPAPQPAEGETPENLVSTLEAPAPAVPVSSSKDDDDDSNAVTYESKTPVQVFTEGATKAVSNIIKIINNVKDSTLNVTLDNVNIDVSKDSKAALSVSGVGNTTITLKGDNTLKSGDYHAGLEHNATDDNGNSNGKLTIQDTDENGSLSAKGGIYGAGIGGGNKKDGQVTITGGTIIAESGYLIGGNGGIFHGGGAGIGGGCQGNGEVEITGGSISSTGYALGAGIGGGCSGDGNVTISGGTINKAASLDSEYFSSSGAGIGGGYHGSGNIKITGDAVVSNATGWGGGAGIGSGCDGASAEVEISGNAALENIQGGPCAAGIGGGQNSSGTVSIRDSATVKNAAGGEYGAGIGGGYGGLGDVSIEGNVTVDAVGGTGGAGIGGGTDAENDSNGNGNKVTIRSNNSGAPTVSAAGGKADMDEWGVSVGGAGIGSGGLGDKKEQADSSIIIEGKVDITAVAGDGNAAIGANGVEQEFTGLADGSSIKRKDADGTDITLPTDPRASDASDSGSSSGGSSDSTPAPEEIVITPAGVQGFWFTGMLGNSISVKADVNGSTIEFATLRYAAALHTTLGQLRQLREQGITHVTFKTMLCTTTFAIDDLLPLGDDATEVVVSHNGKAATLMVGGVVR